MAVDQTALLEAADFMDANECSTLIAIGHGAAGQGTEALLAAFERAAADFDEAARFKWPRENRTEF